MSEQEKADIKLAYQTAAEITYIIAVGLSKAMEKSEARKRHRNHRKDKAVFSTRGCRKIAG
ncbi:hypothetical protein NUACC21_29740 [Scytonema sp. NUACC21]